MPIDTTHNRYDRVTIAMHWVTAGLVPLLWIFGETADLFPRGPWRTGIWSLHVTLGFALALVLVARILWRAGPGRSLPPVDNGALHLLAKVTHYLLYVLLAAVIGLGIANAFVRGYNLFGLWALPRIGDSSLRRPIQGWHELTANAIMVVALAHAGAALAHHYFWKDGVLRRMMSARGG
ncbi:cytochrome b [Microvirga alba]|uniref:Cytochrome b n=1 Tax=Microvirga alba TaxID=2791025 RepID=A0A931BT24_9HYPH|nr:cytochrome b/b6 domain-containing protein [Microvirga alba]MBF9234168.1 cytochrome b [Microvirga alba]